jgi:3-dehydroquinate synthase
VCDFDTISHGEAVFLGMLAACRLSADLGGRIDGKVFEKFRNLYSYRVSQNSLSYNDLTKAMLSDKKRTGKHITFVVLDEWQHPALKTVNNQQLINNAWKVVFDELNNQRRTDTTA